MKLINKKGQLGGMQSFIMTIVVVAVVLGVGLIVVTEFQNATSNGGGVAINTSHYCAGTGSASGVWNGTACTVGTLTTPIPAAFTATGTILTKMATIPTWIGIVIVVALAFIVLGFFYGRQGGQ